MSEDFLKKIMEMARESGAAEEEDLDVDSPLQRHKISENSRAYQNYRRKSQAALDIQRQDLADQNVFGQAVIGKLDFVRKKLAEGSFGPLSRTDLERQLAEVEKKLAGLKTKLAKLITQEGGQSKYRSAFFLAEALESPEADPELKAAFAGDPADLSGGVQDLPLPVFEKLLRSHAQEFEKRQNLFEEYLPVLQQKFLADLDKLAKAGKLPEGVDRLAARKRLKQLEFSLADTTSANLSEISGSFNWHSDMVFISEYLIEEYVAQSLFWDAPDLDRTSSLKNALRQHPEKIWLYKTFCHEMLHALSGRTAERMEVEGETLSVERQRLGLHFWQEEKGSRLAWLNEAVTETLTMEMTGRKEAGSYPAERQLFSLLLTRGRQPLDRQIFLAAYFEHYEPDAAAGQRVEKYHALVQAVEKAYGPQFLIKLDNFIRRHGLRKAVAALEGDWEREIVRSADQAG